MNIPECKRRRLAKEWSHAAHLVTTSTQSPPRLRPGSEFNCSSSVVESNGSALQSLIASHPEGAKNVPGNSIASKTTSTNLARGAITQYGTLQEPASSFKGCDPSKGAGSVATAANAPPHMPSQGVREEGKQSRGQQGNQSPNTITFPFHIPAISKYSVTFHLTLA
ncbi:hypothetical protein EJ04DRAFT_40532 [Polyplosphaeria fusca]|uniref:Uncharacterized protein n=1 Tax=Polyplosphaeria fusca TaxID=682080 RepID=A0A9P4V7L6_9PLEO|nr:hypothetical protein EJ04DRAFT_40532 [Polyplosphaeria fusca]